MLIDNCNINFKTKYSNEIQSEIQSMVHNPRPLGPNTHTITVYLMLYFLCLCFLGEDAAVDVDTEAEAAEMAAELEELETPISYNEVPRMYFGEYDGYYSSWFVQKVVPREIMIQISSIDENGNMKGKAIIAPSDRGDAQYAANGSYNFGATLDKSTGAFVFQGKEWIDKPVGPSGAYSNFSFVTLTGTYDPQTKDIKGTTDNGKFEISPVDPSQYHGSTKFDPAKNGNNFRHNNGQGGGFNNAKNYELDKAYYNALTKGLSKSEKSEMAKHKKEKWEGACYGVSATMGLLFENKVAASDLQDADQNAAQYHDLVTPYDPNSVLKKNTNIRFRNSINYMFLSQFLEKGGQNDASLSMVHSDKAFGGLTNLANNEDSLSVFLFQVVKNVSKGHIYQFCYSYGYDKNGTYKSGGHAVLFTGCEYDSSAKQYKVQIFDMNTVGSDGGTGTFTYMYIPEDFSTFTYMIHSNSKNLADCFKTLRIQDQSKMKALSTTASVQEEVNDRIASTDTTITVPAGKAFTLKNSSGATLISDGESFSGTMTVNDIEMVVNENNSKYIFYVPSSSSFVLTDAEEGADVTVTTPSALVSIEGKGIKEAELKPSTGVTFKGDNAEFESFVTTSNTVSGDSYGMVSVSGKSKGAVSITKNSKKVKASAPGGMTDVTAASYVDGMENSKDYTGTIKSLTFDTEYVLKDDHFVVKQTANIKDQFTKTSGKVRFAVSNNKILKVNNKGILRAKKPGQTDVTLQVKVGNRWVDKETRTFYVEKPVLKKKVTYSELNQSPYTEELVESMGILPDSWVSSNPKVASVDAAGKVVFHKKGSVKISAVYNGVGKKTVKYSTTIKMGGKKKEKKSKKK